MAESMESCPSTPESLRSPVFIVYFYFYFYQARGSPWVQSTPYTIYNIQFINFEPQGKSHFRFSVGYMCVMRTEYICSIAILSKSTRQAKPTASVCANQLEVISVEWAYRTLYTALARTTHPLAGTQYDDPIPVTSDLFFPLVPHPRLWCFRLERASDLSILFISLHSEPLQKKF